MYDGYSFDVDREGLDRSYTRAGRGVPADLRALRPRLHGRRGGLGRDRRSASAGVHGPRGDGRGRRRPVRRVRLRREPREGGDGAAPAPWEDETVTPLAEVETPGQGRHRRRRRVPRHHPLADDQVPRVRDRQGRRRGAAARRPRRERGRAEARPRGRARLALAARSRSRRRRGAPVGFVGPRQLDPARGAIVADESVRGRGQRGDGRGPARLARPRVLARARRDGRRSGRASPQARAGDPCPRCGEPLEIARGIEVGHIFKLGTKYSEALRCEFTDEKRGDPAGRHGDLRDRGRPHDGRGRRAAPRRRRDRLAARARPVRGRARLAQPVRRADARRGRRALRGARRRGPRGLLRRSRRAAGGQVQGRRPDGVSDPGQRRRPGSQGGQASRSSCARDKMRSAQVAGGRGASRPSGAPRPSSPEAAARAPR